MTRQIVQMTATLGFLAICTQVCFAQGITSGGSTNGAFGSRTIGQGVSGGRGTFGGSQVGDLTSAQSGVAQQLQNNQLNVQNLRQPTGFVGRDASEVTTTRTQLGPGGADLRGFGELFSGLAGQNANQANTGANSSRRTLRVTLRLGGGLTPPVGSAVNVEFQNRLTRIPAVRSARSIAVTMVGRTAVLRGEVASSNQRDLVARLARLEPGVSDVRNELTVKSENSTDQPSSGPELPDPFGPAR